MKSTVKINRSELVNMLMNWNFGSQPTTIQYITEPKLTKDGRNRFGTVTKVAAVNSFVGFNYENAINRQLVREGKEPNFEAAPIWKGKGERVNSRIVRHIDNNKLYLSYKYEKSLRSFHFDSNMEFIPLELIKTAFPKRSSYQPTEKTIEIRMIAIDNIRKLKFRKTTYEVVSE